MDISEFLTSVQATFKTGVAGEHAYRPAIQQLVDSLADNVMAVNEPARIKCGAPDFIVNVGDIPVGHIEAKDIGVDISVFKGSNKEQFQRYSAALPNLVYTNGLDWNLYRDGEKVLSVSIADFVMGIQPKPDRFDALAALLQEFIAQRPQTITQPRDLAQRMAGKARLIKDILRKTLYDDEVYDDLSGQYEAFKDSLIHDITPDDFADIYAETIAYGMFAARLHDTTLETFSRQEALELLPRSNPFLRSLFSFVAGHDLDDRLAWVIDDLALVFRACDVAALMTGFGKLTGQQDPFLHFYETFLAAYNPAKRKAAGVWYTPQPVVNFIVRAVDEVLQTEFGLADGLADTSKVTIDWDTGQTEKAKAVYIKKVVHRVQVLDPATGTGTFLAEVIKQIAPKVKNIAPAMWSQYIEQDLVPRLHGFELLMASYAMCHMKLDMILKELGYVATEKPPRLSVFLTNSLEEGIPVNQTLPFSRWLSMEAKGASSIKRDMPIMCVIGNPPYLGEGGVSEGWLGSLMDDYKKEPGGIEKLKERNPKWLNDLYVKFIRLSSHLIEKNGEGVLGFITNHGYLDNPTFRGMRWHLLKTFDRIWVLDLHGNAKKKEVTPDGEPDKNVFDIQQGVSIIIGVKKQGGSEGLAEVMHGDLWGTRDSKYEMLAESNLQSGIFSPLESPAPRYPMVKKDFAALKAYNGGFAINEFMPANSVGIVTARDSLTIGEDKDCLQERVQDFMSLDPEVARDKYKLGKDVRDWRVAWAQRDIRKNFNLSKIVPIVYRPFDQKWTYYTGRSRGFMCYPRHEVMRHHLWGENIGLLTSKAHTNAKFAHAFVSDKPNEASALSATTGSNAMNFPLYLYLNESGLEKTRRINFEPKLHQRIRKLARHTSHGTPDEVQVFDYIYGVLHCPAYRETYAGFLKTDFPRIPWPKTPGKFWAVSGKGTMLRKLHLMEPDAIGDTPYPFTGEGDNNVEKLAFSKGRVWVNKTQYFDSVPAVSWEFYIGGYQPARKWLKDRKGKTLTFDEIRHYQRILKILSETSRIMKSIKMAL